MRHPKIGNFCGEGRPLQQHVPCRYVAMDDLLRFKEEEPRKDLKGPVQEAHFANIRQAQFISRHNVTPRREPRRQQRSWDCRDSQHDLFPVVAQVCFEVPKFAVLENDGQLTWS